tara:strand:+ start:7491 stop:7967 length:477 start_codon:yes stop_codon:yes gene_type:complete
MRKFTQKDLLEEGFWDNFKGVVRAGANVARMVAPEITDPLDKLQNAYTDTKNKFKLGKAGVPDDANTRPLTTHETEQLKNSAKDETMKVDKTTMLNIKMGLQSHDLSILPNSGLYYGGIDPRNGNKLYKVKVQDKNNDARWVVIDTKGHIFKGINPGN